MDRACDMQTLNNNLLILLELPESPMLKILLLLYDRYSNQNLNVGLHQVALILRCYQIHLNGFAYCRLNLYYKYFFNYLFIRHFSRKLIGTYVHNGIYLMIEIETFYKIILFTKTVLPKPDYYNNFYNLYFTCLLYTSPSPRDS